MSKTIYEEALADLEQLKQVAESNAKNAIIDAIAPKIKKLVEKQLLDVDDSSDDEEDILLDLVADADDTNDSESAVGIEIADDGKVTLDLGEFLVSDEESEELNGEEIVEPMDDMVPEELPLESKEEKEEKNESTKVLHNSASLDELNESINTLVSDVKKSKLCDIDALLHRTECLYAQMQESNIDENELALLENNLENVYKQLQLVKKEINNKELTMLNEEEVMLKLDLGDEVDVDAEDVDVEVVASEEPAGEEATEEEAEEEGMDEMKDMDEMDMDETKDMEEMDEDTVLEIDEAELVKELNRLRSARSMNEEEVMLKVDLGDDAEVDADDVEVEVVADEEPAEEAEEAEEAEDILSILGDSLNLIYRFKLL